MMTFSWFISTIFEEKLRQTAVYQYMCSYVLFVQVTLRFSSSFGFAEIAFVKVPKMVKHHSLSQTFLYHLLTDSKMLSSISNKFRFLLHFWAFKRIILLWMQNLINNFNYCIEVTDGDRNHLHEVLLKTSTWWRVDAIGLTKYRG